MAEIVLEGKAQVPQPKLSPNQLRVPCFLQNGYCTMSPFSMLALELFYRFDSTSSKWVTGPGSCISAVALAFKPIFPNYVTLAVTSTGVVDADDDRAYCKRI